MADYFSSLPRDLVVKIFSHLGTPKDVILCSYLSHDLAEAANEPELWHELAQTKYGTEVAEATIRSYNGDWKEMLKDDNRRGGAMPTVNVFKPCFWQYNDNDEFYCCIITALQWSRIPGVLRVYFDARGESDLRTPMSSSIRIRSEDGSSMETFRPITFGSYIVRPNHYKGFLTFRDVLFRRNATYHFCYANLIHGGADYESIPIMTGKLDMALFDSYTLEGDLVRKKETKEAELTRWQKVLPDDFLFRRPDWWV